MTTTRQPHEQRVVDEHLDLASKTAALGAFFYRPMFAGLPQAEQDRLHRQYRIMNEYVAVLVERIAAFPA